MNKILAFYDFESVFGILDNIPSKEKWKSYVKKKINAFWIRKISAMSEGKSTLKFLSPKSMELGVVHNVWSSTGHDIVSIKKANIKARLLAGVYTLQYNRSKFNRQTSSICPLCGKVVENLEHFVMYCEITEPVREHFIVSLRSVLMNIDSDIENLFHDEEIFIQLILDVTNPKIPMVLQTEELITKIEAISRGLVFALHRKRCEVMNIKM